MRRSITLGMVAALLGATPFASANILNNGSFEVGLQGWACSTRGADGYPSDIAVAPDRALATSTADADESRFGCNMRGQPTLLGLAQKLGMRWVFRGPPLLTKRFSASAGARITCVRPIDPQAWRSHMGMIC